MNARDRWLVNLGFNAGWDAHEAFVESAPDPADPTDPRVPSFSRVSNIGDLCDPNCGPLGGDGA